MGDPRKFRKTYEKPRKPWDKPRMVEEIQLHKEYAFHTKKELWKSVSKLRNFRALARKLIALRGTKQAEKEAKQILLKLYKIGLVKKEAVLEDVLSLNVRDILERRLQTIVLRKGLANTPKQARQFITHGHIFVKNKKITSPSYLVSKSEEEEIKYSQGFKGVIEDVRRKEAKKRSKAQKTSSKKVVEQRDESEETVEGTKEKGIVKEK